MEQLNCTSGTASDTGERRKGLIGLSIGHALADGYGTIPAALLNSLARHLGRSYASVSLVVGIGAAANGLASMIVGLGSDRWPHIRRRLILVGAAVTVLTMSAVGIIGSFGLLILVCGVGAFACGAFHPPAFVAAGDISHPRRQHGLSIIMAAGVAASGLGPVLVTQVVKFFGLWGTVLCAVPGIALLVTAALLLRRWNGAGAPAPTETQHAAARTGQASRQARGWLALLFANATLRAFAQVSIVVLVSRLMEHDWGLSVAASGLGLGAMQVGAGLGGLVGARLTPTGRERRTVLVCALLNIIVLVPMAVTGGGIWCLWLFVYGLCINGPGPVVVSMAQRIAPQRGSFVSALMVSLAFAVGGPLASVTAPQLLENLGQGPTMGALAAVLALSWLAAARLPAVGSGSSAPGTGQPD